MLLGCQGHLQSCQRKEASMEYLHLLKQWLFMQALQQRSLQLVKLLREEYSLALSRDPGLGRELALVEAKHFGVKPQGAGLEGLFGNMFGSLLG